MTGHPCTCWTGPVALHDGHCCLLTVPADDTQPLPCGHDDEGRAAWQDALRQHAADPTPTTDQLDLLTTEGHPA